MRKALRNFSRFFIGLIFIYSGFVKVVDPMGFAYKMTDYFVALNLEFLSGIALVFAVIMCVAELVIGIALTFNLVPKLAAWAVVLFMAFFTPLTLWLAVANPISDCGCFGDALILTNWQTFFKNVVIDIFVVIIFIERKKYVPAYNTLFQWSLGIFFTAASFGLAIYCLRHLPIIDFRPYHIGANIQEGMSIPEREKDNVDIIESVFIYEKDGVRQKFTSGNIPDETWKFVDAEHKVIKEGYKPPIHDFTIEPVYISGITPDPQTDEFVNAYDMQFIYSRGEEKETFTIDMLPDNTWIFEELIYEGDVDHSSLKLTYLSPEGSEEIFTLDNLPPSGYIYLDAEYESENTDYNTFYGQDIAPYILEDDNYVFLAIMTHVEDAKTKHLEELNEIAAFCRLKSYGFYCLTGSNEEHILEFINKHDALYSFYNTDPTTLKTIIRSNPGLLLMKKGTILNKWSHNDLPEIKDLQDNLEATSISEHQANNENNIAILWILALSLFMSLFNNFYNRMVRKKFLAR